MATNNGSIHNLGNASSASFSLLGGRYGVTVVASVFNSATVDLQILGPDGSTFLSVLTTPFTANGTASVYLPPGTYKWVIGGSPTAVFASEILIREGSR